MTPEVQCALPRSGQPVARNMSAPPRSTVTVRAVALQPVRPKRSWESPAPELPPCGLRLLCRIDLDALIRARIPRALAKARTAKWKATDVDAALDHDHRRLLAALVLARDPLRKRRGAFAAMRAASAVPAEALHDELVATVRKWDGRALGLPAVGFFRDRPEARELPDAPREHDVARALYVACHRYGDLFLRDADPIVRLSGHAVDLVGAIEGYES